MRDCLSFEIRLNSKRTKTWIGQPHLLQNLEKKFGNDVQYRRSTKNPGTPNFEIVCPTNDDEKISPEKQKQYCSGVGMLLYLVKHSHPDIANAVRELSKVLDGANMAAYKEIH